MKVYSFDQIEQIIKQQKYNHCGLYRQDGSKWVSLVAFNREKNKTPSYDFAIKRMKEIKTRFEILDDGFYFVRCCTGFAPNIVPDVFMVKKGNISDENQPVNVTVNMPGMKENSKPPKEHVLSLQAALDHVKENAELKSENAVLKSENERLKKEVLELEAELNTLDDDDDAGGMGEGIKSFFSAESPLAVMADKYFALKEREMLMKERQQFREFQKSGFNGSNPQRPPRRAAQQNGNGKQPPQPGTPQYEAYIEKLEGMNDDEFQNEMIALQQSYPDFYEIVQAEFEEQEDE